MDIKFQVEDKSEGIKSLEELLIFHHYHKPSKRDKGIIIKYASIVPCLSNGRVKHLCLLYANTGKISIKTYKRVQTHNKYTSDKMNKIELAYSHNLRGTYSLQSAIGLR